MRYSFSTALLAVAYQGIASSLPSSSVAAQDRGRVVGAVLSTAGVPVEHAEVAADSSYWRTTSDRAGHFTILLPPGRWTLRIRRLGFAQQAVDVDVDGIANADTVRIRLADAVGALQGIVVNAERTPPLAATITAANARHAPPLGESDLFRMLPLLPGVSQPNDLLGRFHLAGGASDEHGVYLDGHPLQAPFHANNLLGAFNVAALERADVLMHHLPASVDGHLSGTVQLESKRLTAPPQREAVVSLLSASVTAAEPLVVYGVGVLASARATYLDQILRRVAASSGSDDLSVPQYRDLLIRASHRNRWGLRSETIAYAARDKWLNTNAVDPRRPLAWGETLGGVRFGWEPGRWSSDLRLSTNTATVAYGDARADTVISGAGDFIDVVQTRLSAAASVRYASLRWQAEGGLGIDRKAHRHEWQSPEVATLFTGAMPMQYQGTETQQIVRAFGGLSARLWNSWHFTTGAHTSAIGGRSYLAPRVLFSGSPASSIDLALALDRRHQFDAILGEPVEASITQPQFLLPVPRRADVAALSIAATPGSAWRGWTWSPTLTLYAKRYQDRTVPAAAAADTAPAGASAEQLFDRVTARTVGGALRTLVTRSNGTVLDAAYTRQTAMEARANRQRPTAWDAPHQLTGFVGLPAWRRWTLTATGQVRSGQAVTPVIARIFEPVPGGMGPRFIYGEPNSARLPAYARLDVGVRKVWTARGAEWTVAVQALNALGRQNVMEYDLRRYFGCAGYQECAERSALRRGIPFIPSVGMEVRW